MKEFGGELDRDIDRTSGAGEEDPEEEEKFCCKCGCPLGDDHPRAICNDCLYEES